MIVVLHLRQTLTRNLQVIRQIIIAGRHDQLARPMHQLAPKLVRRMHREVSIRSRHAVHILILSNVELIVLRHLPVILQRLRPRRLLIRRRERHIANLQQLRRRKKCHVRRIMKQRIRQTTLIHQHDAQPQTLRRNRTRQTRRPRADHQNILHFTHTFVHTLIVRMLQPPPKVRRK